MKYTVTQLRIVWYDSIHGVDSYTTEALHEANTAETSETKAGERGS